jgi:glyoxylase-like metal-dependent hydrolase (beta-lactamase superfamily II)
MTPLNCTFYSTGHCHSLERFVRSDGSYFKKCRFPATIALIEHPERGRILFDTGYSKQLFSVCSKFPYRLYTLLNPVTIERSALEIVGEEIDYVIISHFHADHICGLCDFPKAKYLYLEGALVPMTGLAGVKKAYIPGLLPEDFSKRSQALSKVDYPTGLKPFEKGIDLFGDGSIIGIPLPGHANILSFRYPWTGIPCCRRMLANPSNRKRRKAPSPGTDGP